MTLAENSDLQTISLILTKDQVRKLKEIRDVQHVDHRRVSLSDVGREVVAAGLLMFSHARNIGFSASAKDVSPEPMNESNAA